MAFPATFILVYYIDKIGDVMIAIAYHLRRNPLGDRYDLAAHHQHAMIVARQMALHHNAAAMLYRDLKAFPDLFFIQQCRADTTTLIAAQRLRPQRTAKPFRERSGFIRSPNNHPPRPRHSRAGPQGSTEDGRGGKTR